MNKDALQNKEKFEAPVCVPRGEISLFDVWLILVKRKGIFLITFMLATIAAVVLIFLVKPVYMSKAVIQIGSVGVVDGNFIKAVQLEPPSSVIARLQAKYTPCVTGTKKLPCLDKATIEGRPEDGIIVCHSKAPSPQEARAFLARILNELIQAHNIIYSTRVKLQQEYLAAMEKQLDNFRSREKLLRVEKIGSSSGEKVLVGLLAIEDMRLQVEGLHLVNDLHHHQEALSRNYTRHTRYILKPVLIKSPVKPRPALYLALGITLGVFLGLFCVFMTEFIANSRQRMRDVREREEIM